jgi:DNA invertase Pin-like site-specific DNA recombinase
MRNAYSYARFSTPGQAEGRSLQRQLEAARAYCKRHGLALQERAFTDSGISAYHGANASHGELADFLDLVKQGRIPKGSVLVVENLDRITRMTPDAATALIMQIVKGGVDIHSISPEQQFTRGTIHKPEVWIPLQVAFCLSAEESRKKGERCADAWEAKRRALAEGVKFGKKCPAWLRPSADGKGYVVVEAKARMVRAIFQWAADGLGKARITERLNREFPEGLRGKGWRAATVCEILRSRAVLGEFTPHVGTHARRGRKKTSRPAGEAVKGYYPAVIAEDVFYRVQTGLSGRKSGPTGGHDLGVPNLFRGLAHDAHDGHRMALSACRGRQFLVSAGALKKLPGCAFRTVPYAELEDAILSLLSELKAADVVVANGAQAALEAASGRLTGINHRIAQVHERARAADDVLPLLDLLTQLDADRKAAVVALEEARQKAANEAGDVLGESLSLIALLRDADDKEREDLRRRVRAALVRLVERVDVLPVRRGKVVLLVAAQVRFRQSGKCRSYLVRIGRRGDWHAVSLADAAPDAGDLDLRKPDHARRLAEALENVPLG